MCNVVFSFLALLRDASRLPESSASGAHGRVVFVLVVASMASGPRGRVGVGILSFAAAGTAAPPARRRNFVDPGYSSWSRCVEVRESDYACAER